MTPEQRHDREYAELLRERHALERVARAVVDDYVRTFKGTLNTTIIAMRDRLADIKAIRKRHQEQAIGRKQG